MGYWWGDRSGDIPQTKAIASNNVWWRRSFFRSNDVEQASCLFGRIKLVVGIRCVRLAADNARGCSGWVIGGAIAFADE